MQTTGNNNYNILLGGSLLFVTICFVLQTSNSSIDAYGYAADIRYGENLFRPHHLLYNALGYVLSLVFGIVETLILMKIVNTLFALGCLWIFYQILKMMNFDRWLVLSSMCIAGASFGLLRFATENEVYVIPLFFSLWGTYYYIKHYETLNTIHIVFAALLMALAALFHQIHAIWWVVTTVFCFKQGRKEALLFFIVSAAIIIGTYFVVIVFYLNESLNFESISHFVLYDYYLGEAKSSIAFSNFYLTIINFIRSFIQVHGNIYFLFKSNLLYTIPILIIIGLLILQIKSYIKPRNKESHPQENHSQIRKYILAVGLAQLLFAFYAQGNAEFMVMLPFLCVFYLAFILQKHNLNYGVLGFAICIWNISFGLFPQRFYDMQGREYMMKHYNKSDIYILSNANIYRNMFYYINRDSCGNIFKTPSDYKDKNQDYLFLDSLIKHSDKLVLTDAINSPGIISRKSMLSDHFDANFFSNYQLSTYFVHSSPLGDYKLTKVKNGK